MRSALLFLALLAGPACVTVRPAPARLAQLRIRVAEHIVTTNPNDQALRQDLRGVFEGALREAGYQVVDAEPYDLLAILGISRQTMPSRISVRFEREGSAVEELSQQGGWKVVARELVNAMAGSQRLLALAPDTVAKAPAVIAANPPPAAPKAAGLATGVLAVLEFRNKLGPADRAGVDAGYFTDLARATALKAVPSLQVITRENLLVLLQASGKSLEECEGECEVDTGRRIGADLVMSGELLKVGSSLKLSLRLHETRSGRLLAGEVGEGATVDALDKNTARAVQALLAPVAR